MSKSLCLLAVFALSLSACAPVMQQNTAGACIDVATHQALACASANHQQVEAQEQEPQKKAPPPGPGKKDFTTWMLLLTMGFGALYLMAFK